MDRYKDGKNIRAKQIMTIFLQSLSEPFENKTLKIILLQFGNSLELVLVSLEQLQFRALCAGKKSFISSVFLGVAALITGN